MASSPVSNELNGFTHVWSPPATPDAPVMLLLHGTGGDEHDLIELGSFLAPGAGLLSPRGRVIESGRYNRFFRRLAEGVFDIDDLKLRTHELAEFVGEAAKKYGFDPTNVIAAGFSNGANIAASLLLLRPGILRAAALFSPMTPLMPDLKPDLSGTPVFIGAGRLDPIASPQETERLAALLRDCGAPVELFYHAGGHSLTQDEALAAREWLSGIALLPIG